MTKNVIVTRLNGDLKKLREAHLRLKEEYDWNKGFEWDVFFTTKSKGSCRCIKSLEEFKYNLSDFKILTYNDLLEQYEVDYEYWERLELGYCTKADLINKIISLRSNIKYLLR